MGSLGTEDSPFVWGNWEDPCTMETLKDLDWLSGEQEENYYHFLKKITGN